MFQPMPTRRPKIAASQRGNLPEAGSALIGRALAAKEVHVLMSAQPQEGLNTAYIAGLGYYAPILYPYIFMALGSAAGMTVVEDVLGITKSRHGVG
jgi:hypothetical protein